MLRRIAMLYAIEDQVRGTSTEERRTMRAEQARVIVDDLHLYLEARLRQVSAKSKLAEAIRYALTRWTGLSLFLDDGRVELDSNTVERSIRPLALNRKNALFAGSDDRARHRRCRMGSRLCERSGLQSRLFARLRKATRHMARPDRMRRPRLDLLIIEASNKRPSVRPRLEPSFVEHSKNDAKVPDPDHEG